MRKKLEPGEYTTTISSLRQDSKNPLRLYLTLEIIDPEMEQTRFFVFHSPSRAYTVLTAKNIHHAGNKAAKLYGGAFTGLTKEEPKSIHWKFLPVKKFGEQIRSAL